MRYFLSTWQDVGNGAEVELLQFHLLCWTRPVSSWYNLQHLPEVTPKPRPAVDAALTVVSSLNKAKEVPHREAKNDEDLPLWQDHPAGGIYARKHSGLVWQDLQPFPLPTSAHKAQWDYISLLKELWPVQTCAQSKGGKRECKKDSREPELRNNAAQ